MKYFTKSENKYTCDSKTEKISIELNQDGWRFEYEVYESTTTCYEEWWCAKNNVDMDELDYGNPLKVSESDDLCADCPREVVYKLDSISTSWGDYADLDLNYPVNNLEEFRVPLKKIMRTSYAKTHRLMTTHLSQKWGVK